VLRGGGLAVIAAVCWFLFSTQGFATSGNVDAILLSSSLVGLLALGQTAIMISGSFFSLSLAATTAISAMVFLSGLRFGLVPAFALALLFGAVSSGIQGLPVGAWGANPIIVTIGFGSVMEGAIVLITGGSTVNIPAGAPSINFLTTSADGIPFGFFVLIVATVALEFVLRRTRLGLSTYLVGENRRAARTAGLPVGRVALGVFVVAGLCAAVAGILAGAVSQGATLSIEGTLSFNAIAATLIGGCAVAGGRGSAVATLAGTIGISAINSALSLRGYANGVQILVEGLIVFVVVIIVHLRTRSRS
jgi:ribose/xylose/arabinose/galactoside ABC-type transport system permease subunit